MKAVRYLPFAVLAFSVMTPRAGADPQTSNPEDSAYAKDDADGVPLIVREPQAQHLTPEEIAAIHKRQDQAAQDKDWLVRAYEQELQNHSNANPASDPNGNLYYQISSNKELARLAGLPALASDSEVNANPSPSPTPTPQNGTASHPDASPDATNPSSLHDSFFKPLLSQSGAPNGSGFHSLNSPLSISLAPSLFGPRTARQVVRPARNQTESDDSFDLETPGMIASEKDPLADPTAPDLSLNVLPGETADEARARVESNNSIELALPMDADRLHEVQAAALSAPGAPTTTTTAASPNAAPPTVKPAAVKDENAPLPVSELHQINPVRAPIANPYDILNR